MIARDGQRTFMWCEVFQGSDGKFVRRFAVVGCENGGIRWTLGEAEYTVHVVSGIRTLCCEMVLYITDEPVLIVCTGASAEKAHEIIQMLLAECFTLM